MSATKNLEEFLDRMKQLFVEFEITGDAEEDEEGEFQFSLYDKQDKFMTGIRSIRKEGRISLNKK